MSLHVLEFKSRVLLYSGFSKYNFIQAGSRLKTLRLVIGDISLDGPCGGGTITLHTTTHQGWELLVQGLSELGVTETKRLKRVL